MSDTFRSEYKELDQVTKDKISSIKDKARILLSEIESFPLEGEALRHRALAKTNLEQAIMWAVKSITG